MSDSDMKRAFEEALAENPDDKVTRAVYADWLEERGLDDEATRQRNWPPDEDDREDDPIDFCCASEDEPERCC